MANQHHPDKRAVTYWFPKDLVAALHAEAQRRGVTSVDIVRVAVERELGWDSGAGSTEMLLVETTAKDRGADGAPA